jgi:hypothetical protein
MEDSSERQRPAVTVLDVIAMSPIECYGVLATLAIDRDPAVTLALSCAVARILDRTRAAGPPPAGLT